MRYTERLQKSTRPGKFFLLLIFFFLILAISAFGQETKEERKLLSYARKALNSSDYKEAIEYYKELIKINPQNPDYNYELGLSIFESGVEKNKAAEYFQRALSQDTQPLPDMFLYAGRAEQFNGNFQLAINNYNRYEEALEEQGLYPEDLGVNVKRLIEMAENGKVQFENSKDFIVITNLGPNINTASPEYSPVIRDDESLILFTSRRENTTGGEVAPEDGKPYEDIYYSLNIEGTWSPASNYDSTQLFMSSEINTPSHDATITFSNGEAKLYLYRNQGVWYSVLEEGVWTPPVQASDRINTKKGYEPSVYISENQQTMFVVSDLPSGHGGTDLYITTKDDQGIWRELENLGKKINTRFNEDAPFLTQDGNTLYFASTGHNSMGEFDIFKTVLDEKGEWSEPENLGRPINTPGNDIYFVTTNDGSIGYYSSDRAGGMGGMDIYRIIIDCKMVNITNVNGMVYSEDYAKPVKAQITIKDPITQEVLQQYTSSAATGKYELRLKTETTYAFLIEADGYLPHQGTFTVPRQCEYYALYQEVKIDNLEDSSGNIYAQRAFINNAFFDVDAQASEKFVHKPITEFSETQQDSLRSLVASSYEPIEMTNYVKLVDIVDTNGNVLAAASIGDKPVEFVQTKDQRVREYMTAVLAGDEHYYKTEYPEARADYTVATVIKEDEAYPKQQIAAINETLAPAKPETPAMASTTETDSASAEMPLALAEDVLKADSETPEGPLPEAKTEISDATSAEPQTANEATTEAPGETSEEVASQEPVTEEEIASPQPAEEATDQVPVQQFGDETVVFRNILFDFDKSFLRQLSKEELEKVYAYMEANPEMEVQIDGHTDWIGTVEYNMALSERRALSAYNYLKEKGLIETRLTYQFFGESMPVAPNSNADGSDNPEGRQLNRRCEFKIDKIGTAENVVMKF